jgi:polar amino acid transport system permease protein
LQDSGINILFEGQNLQRILEGLGQTVFVAIISVVLSFILGLLVGMLMTSRNIVVRFVTRLYLEVVRIVPVLVMLYILYFGLTRWTGIHIDNRVIAIFVFTFWGTAEMADIVRASVTSIPKIQWESGQALGLICRATLCVCHYSSDRPAHRSTGHQFGYQDGENDSPVAA